MARTDVLELLKAARHLEVGDAADRGNSAHHLVVHQALPNRTQRGVMGSELGSEGDRERGFEGEGGG